MMVKRRLAVQRGKGLEMVGGRRFFSVNVNCYLTISAQASARPAGAPVDRVQAMSGWAYGRMKEVEALSRCHAVMPGTMLADLLGVGALRLTRP
jgi:hypothetical protein